MKLFEVFKVLGDLGVGGGKEFDISVFLWGKKG
jgi:hypothetical protein